MSGPHFVVVFSGDRVIEAAHNNPGGYRPLTEISQGDYVVVNCDIGIVGGNQSGIVKVEARKVTASMPVRFGEMCFLHEGTPGNITASPMPTTQLTPQQCRNTIDAIKKEYHWWWGNTPREVKSSLQAAFTQEDEAREFVRRGTELVSKHKHDKGKKLIEKGLSLHPRMSGARVELGKIAVDSGHVSEAIKWFEDELKLASEPRELSARSYLAAIYQAMGDVTAAEMHAQAAMETESYRRTPSALAPEVVQKIRLAVQKAAGATAPRTKTDGPQRCNRKNWWRFWR